MTTHEVRLFTFKAGLLSRIAHDLRLHVERFRIARHDDEIVASLDASSIVVDGVMHGSRLDPDGLGVRDRAKIAETIRSEVLHARAHPNIEFRGTLNADAGERIRVKGTLTLLGVRRPVSLDAVRSGQRVRGSVTLTPSEFGIRPYKALAGAIRLQDRVRIDLDLDAAALSL